MADKLEESYVNSKWELLKDLVVQISRDTTETVVTCSSLRPSIFLDAPLGVGGYEDNIGTATPMPKEVRDSLLGHVTDAGEITGKRTLSEAVMKSWEDTNLVAGSIHKTVFPGMPHEDAMDYFHKLLGYYHDRGGSHFYVIAIQAWMTKFIDASRQVERISEMPPDDRELGIIIMDSVRGSKQVNVQYAPVTNISFNETGGDPHVDAEGDDCTCAGVNKIGKWRPVKLPDDPDNTGKETIIW